MFSPQQSSDSSLIRAARVFALLALWLVPVSTAMTNVSMLLFAGATLLAPETWQRGWTAGCHPVGGSALLLFTGLALSLAYSAAPLPIGALWLVKYRKLLFIPLLLIAFRGVNRTGAARFGLFISLVCTLLLSITNYFDLTSVGTLHDASTPMAHAWVFKNHITAGLFSALLFNMSVDMARSAQRSLIKVGFYSLALIALVHIFGILQSRTAQLITIVLALYQAYRVAASARGSLQPRATWRAVFFVLAGATLISALVYLKSERLSQISTEIAAYRQRNEATSAGLRIEWTRKSLTLFSHRPLLGYGIAGVRQEFERMTSGLDGARGVTTANPHNQYLLMAAELGIAGLGVFIYILIQIARGAARLPSAPRQLLGGWLFIFTAGCLANSLLLDFSEGYLFVLLSGILLGGAERLQPYARMEKRHG